MAEHSSPPMYTLPTPAGAHLALRRRVRHPREILSLVIAIVGSAILLALSVQELADALRNRREANVYAVVLVFGPLIVWFLRGQLWAQQRVRGIKITPTQYPEAFEMVASAAAQAGLRFIPDAYVVLGNGVINAAASGHGRRRYVFVHSDLLEVGGAARDPEALRFVIAHEVGHIAAGHTSYWRMLATLGAGWIPFVGSTLSRSQEYTADNYGMALAPAGAKAAMATLAGGKYLVRTVDVDTMADRATVERGFFVWFVNATASHPVLLWRMSALRDRRTAGRLLWRPSEPWPGEREHRPGGFVLPPLVGLAPVDAAHVLTHSGLHPAGLGSPPAQGEEAWAGADLRPTTAEAAATSTPSAANPDPTSEGAR